MKIRLIAGVVAVVLAAVGSVLLVSYIRGADARAMAGLETVNVLVAADPIAKGTNAADLAGLVEAKQLPRNAVLDGGVTNLDQLAGETALVPLSPGEQLLGSKFGQPAANAGPAVAPELQQITMLLDLQRAVGGNLKPGDTVGIFMSVKDSQQTHLVAHKVLVTNVQWPASQSGGSAHNASASDQAATQSPVPDVADKILVTVATTAPVAEKIAWSAEPDFGSIWLSDEPAGADENGTKIIDGTKVYQ